MYLDTNVIVTNCRYRVGLHTISFCHNSRPAVMLEDDNIIIASLGDQAWILSSLPASTAVP